MLKSRTRSVLVYGFACRCRIQCPSLEIGKYPLLLFFWEDLYRCSVGIFVFWCSIRWGFESHEKSHLHRDVLPKKKDGRKDRLVPFLFSKKIQNCRFALKVEKKIFRKKKKSSPSMLVCMLAWQKRKINAAVC